MKTLAKVTCPYCGQTETLSASMTSNYFHLFWIKLFKIATYKFVECSHCKRVYYPEELTQEMKKAMDNHR